MISQIKSNYKPLLSLIFLGLVMIFFQNCQGKFSSVSEENLDSQLSNRVFAAGINSESFVEKHKNSIRVMTYNIQGGFSDNKFTKSNLDATVELIKEHETDVVLLQEVDKNSLRAKGLMHPQQQALNKKYHDQAKYMAGKLKFKYYFLGKKWGGGEYGLAILSRWPLDTIRTYEYVIEGYEKVILSAKVNHPTYPVYVVNMHLISGGLHLEENYNVVSKWLRQTFNDYDTRNYKIIIGGDFNTYEGMTIHYNKEKEEYQLKTLLKKNHGGPKDIGSVYYKKILNLLSQTTKNRFADPFYSCNNLGLDNTDNFFATKSSTCKAPSSEDEDARDDYLNCKQEKEWFRRIDYLLYRGVLCSNYRVLTHMIRNSDHYPVMVDFLPTAKTVKDKL